MLPVREMKTGNVFQIFFLTVADKTGQDEKTALAEFHPFHKTLAITGSSNWREKPKISMEMGKLDESGPLADEINPPAN
jgi:hypothetical protein